MTQEICRIGARRELFVDHYLIERLTGAHLQLHHPQHANVAITHDAPWEGRYTLYTTVIHDGELYRLYYRGWAEAAGKSNAVTCYAFSRDGVHFEKPDLGLCPFAGSTHNNIILTGESAGEDVVTHNFCPMLDARPGVAEDQRFKAFGGSFKSGMFAFTSADGIRWQRLGDKPLVTHPTFSFDSQNVPFWSESEGCYLFYYRTFKPVPGVPGHGVRWISRRTSDDFLHWSEPVEMETPAAPYEHFYTNQTHPYFRAPHIYVALAARFMPGRNAISAQEAQSLDVPEKYFNDLSDGVLMTSRGGASYQRTFLESFIRPGPGQSNWVSRTNYPVLGVVPAGSEQMALYVSRHYTQPSNFTERCLLRNDGFVSVHAGYAGGELLSKPLVFSGSRLSLNYATSAAGSMTLEIQDAAGKPIAGFSQADSKEIVGDHIDATAVWKAGSDVSSLAGRPVRLRVTLKDADLYSLQFCS